jgi:hypothetical protein
MRWLVTVLAGMMLASGWTEEAKAMVRSSRRIPHRVIPVEGFAVFPKNWDDEEKNRTTVIRNLDGWS